MPTASGNTETGAEVRDRFKPITEDFIQSSTDSGSFSRGRSYYRNGHILEPMLRGATLQAQCAGSDYEPYIVKATLVPASEKGSKALAGYECNCPRGGFCKHVVALLLTWLHKPEQFTLRPEVADLLKDKSREELQALLLQMLERRPELESLLDLPLPPSGVESGGGAALTVDPKDIRRQVKMAFRNAGYEWGADRRIADDLDRLKRLGDNFARSGQWANAQAIYSAIALETAEHYGETEDEGDIAGVVEECITGMAACLDAQASLPESERMPPEVRLELFRSLFDIWNDDSGLGDNDVAADVPEIIARSATAAERETVEAWVRKGMRSGSGDFYQQYHNRGLVEFLVTLKEHAGLDDEEMLREYRNFQLYEDMANLLLERGRIEEALDVAREHLDNPHEAMQFANKLMAIGKEQVAAGLAFIETRLREAEQAQRPSKTSRPDRTVAQNHLISQYLSWLGEQYRKHGMGSEALAIELRRFEAAPGQQTYADVKAAAQLRGQPAEVWQELRPSLIATLEKKGAWSSLVAIYLDEKDVRSALDTLPRTETRGANVYFDPYSWQQGNLSIRVAEAAEKDYPDEAIALYRRAAENLIAQRGRESYRQAAQYLSRVRKLYEQQQRGEEWQKVIANLRAENKSLPALKQELDALKLG